MCERTYILNPRRLPQVLEVELLEERAHRVEKAAFGAAATSRVGLALLPQFVVPKTFAVVGALCGLAAKDPPASARLALKLAYEMRALCCSTVRTARARGGL